MDPETLLAPIPDHVRPAQDADLEHLVELAKAFYRQNRFAAGRDHLHANLRVMLGGAGHVAVAVRGVRVTGFAITRTTYGLEHGYFAQLQDLYVAPEFRGNGFGDALVGDAADWAYSRGATRLELVIAPTRGDIAHLDTYFARGGFIDEGRQMRHLPLKPRAADAPAVH